MLWPQKKFRQLISLRRRRPVAAHPCVKAADRAKVRLPFIRPQAQEVDCLVWLARKKVLKPCPGHRTAPAQTQEGWASAFLSTNGENNIPWFEGWGRGLLKEFRCIRPGWGEPKKLTGLCSSRHFPQHACEDKPWTSPTQTHFRFPAKLYLNQFPADCLQHSTGSGQMLTSGRSGSAGSKNMSTSTIAATTAMSQPHSTTPQGGGGILWPALYLSTLHQPNHNPT